MRPQTGTTALCGPCHSFSRPWRVDGRIEFAHFVVTQIEHVEHGALREKLEAGENLAALRR